MNALKTLGPVVMGIEASKHHAAGRGAYGNVYIGVPKTHPTGCQLVNVWSDILGRTAETTRSVPVHVISDDQQDVGSLDGSGKLSLNLANRKGAEEDEQSFLHDEAGLETRPTSEPSSTYP